MFKNKIAIPTMVLLFLTAAAIGRSTFGTEVVVPVSEVQASDTSVVVEKDSLYFDSLSLSLKKIPTVQNMYTVGKKSIGKWAKLFIAVKIVESGNDGDNSIYARRDFNLTGMRQPKARKTLSLGATRSNYATFASWYDCMVDFGMYLNGMEKGFKKKFHKSPTSKDMVMYMYGKYNSHPVWRDRTLAVLKKFDLK
ncbi:MAG: glucosaminidase domain-containing protein [Bacteroidota bacterium]